MKWVLYAFSLIWIVFGSYAILYTSQTKDIMRSVFGKANPRLIAFFPFILGLLLILCASASQYAWFIRLIGMLAILKGIFLFINPNRMADRVNEWYLNQASNQVYRLFGIVAILFGSAIFSWIL